MAASERAKGDRGGEEGGSKADASASKKHLHIYASLAAGLAVEVVLIACGVNLQWHWLVLYASLLIPLSPVATSGVTFFKGNLSEQDRSAQGFALLTASSFISWIFAKSVQNASTLGAKFGIMGGLAYAAWYTSFASAAYVCYRLRKTFKVSSLAQAVVQRYVIPTHSLSLYLSMRDVKRPGRTREKRPNDGKKERFRHEC